MIEKLRYGIYKVVPYDLLSVFEPHELDMVINGRKEIDLSDLKLNVKYTNCGPTDGLVTWFWDYMHGLSQTQIENVLHFVTGNSRVPILGFKYLESNRGEYQLFEVKQVAFNPVEPYPKSHTCFNRLELPLYPDKATFEKNIVYIAVENNYFGL